MQESNNKKVQKQNQKISQILQICLLINAFLIFLAYMARRVKNSDLNYQRFLTSTIDESTNSSSSWIIIGFTDINYLPIAKIWYKQLTTLGYRNHRLIALDEKTLETCQSEKIRVSKSSKYFNKNKMSFIKLWPIRIETVYQFLTGSHVVDFKNIPKNVFISDVDTIWVKYLDLDQISSWNSNKYSIDSYHGTGRNFPPEFYKKYHFVIAGGIAGFKSNKNTLKLFEMMRKQCQITAKSIGPGCDDQRTINMLFLYKYKFEFEKISFITTKNHSRIGNAKNRNLTSLIFDDQNLVIRGTFDEFDFDQRCASINDEIKPWIVSPNSGAKTIESKIRMFQKIKNCFEPNVLEL